MTFEAIRAGVNYDEPEEGRGVTLVIEIEPSMTYDDVIDHAQEVGTNARHAFIRPVIDEASVRELAKRLGALVASWDGADGE